VLYRTSARYVVATGVPAVVNFLALAVYSRLLRPAEYGTYSLVVAAVAMANALGFQWIRSAARRYLPADATREELLAALRRVYGGLVALAAVLALGYAVARPGHLPLVLLGFGVLVSQAWFELNLEVQLADLRPGRYGAMLMARSLTALAAGVSLVLAGFGAAGVLVGVLLGYLVPAAWVTPGTWRGLPGGAAPGERIRALTRYGLPLTAGYALHFVIDSSDRFLLGALRDLGETGAYSVSYDLAAQSLTLLLVMVNLAAFPLALRALQEHGAEAARARLREQAVALGAIALPAAAGFALLSPAIAATLLGAAYRDAAARLMPVIIAAVLLGGLKTYYFDVAFQFGERTGEIVRIGAVAALLNVGLNLAWIPRHGAVGAAWATVAAFGAGLLLSAWRGRAVFPLPVPWRAWATSALATLVMGGAVWPLRAVDGLLPLAAAIALGAVVYAAVLLALDLEGARGAVAGALRARRAAGSAPS
jgi:O-antigen/teichoic acid export membrane protein